MPKIWNSVNQQWKYKLQYLPCKAIVAWQRFCQKRNGSVQLCRHSSWTKTILFQNRTVLFFKPRKLLRHEHTVGSYHISTSLHLLAFLGRWFRTNHQRWWSILPLLTCKIGNISNNGYHSCAACIWSISMTKLVWSLLTESFGCVRLADLRKPAIGCRINNESLPVRRKSKAAFDYLSKNTILPWIVRGAGRSTAPLLVFFGRLSAGFFVEFFFAFGGLQASVMTSIHLFS